MVMSKGADRAEVDRLVGELDDLGPYEGWRFSYEYPGFFCYSHLDLPFRVMFTPDWQGEQQLPIEVQGDDGQHHEAYSAVLPLPREGRTGEKLFSMVQSTLDMLAALPRAAPTFELTVRLTADEIAALPRALDHVRLHMAHQHPWQVRDAAMTAIGKLVSASRVAK